MAIVCAPSLCRPLSQSSVPLRPRLAAQFDGNWRMVAVTTRGHCGKIPMGLGISHGRIYSTGGSFVSHPIQLGGRVSASGQVSDECGGWPAQRPWDRTVRSVSGQRDVGWYRALRCLLGRLERHCGQVRFVRTLSIDRPRGCVQRVKLGRCQPRSRRVASRRIGRDSCRCSVQPSPRRYPTLPHGASSS